MSWDFLSSGNQVEMDCVVDCDNKFCSNKMIDNLNADLLSPTHFAWHYGMTCKSVQMIG